MYEECGSFMGGKDNHVLHVSRCYVNRIIHSVSKSLIQKP